MKCRTLIVLAIPCLIVGCNHQPNTSRVGRNMMDSSFRYPGDPKAAMFAFISALDQRNARAAWRLLAPDRKSVTHVEEMDRFMSDPKYKTQSKVIAVVFHGSAQADVEYQSDIVRRANPKAHGSWRFIGQVVRLSSGAWAVDAIDIPTPASEFPERQTWNHEHFRPLIQAMKGSGH